MQDLLIFIIDEILESGSKMRNARTVIAGVLCALMICCMLGNAYTVKGKEMLLAPENKETKDQNTENSKIEDNNTENEEELNKGAKKEDTSMQIGAPSALLMEASTGTVLFEQDADTKRPPASVTKIMTMLLIFDAVESKKISAILEDVIQRYNNGMVDTVEFLEKVLIPSAEQMKEADKRGENLGLDYREYAFYTALEVNNSAVAVMGDEILKHIAQELLKTVRNSTTIDWTIKESVQATLRRNIRRILRKFGYPPDLQEKAVDTVITQAKMLAEDLVKNDKTTEQ